MSMLGHALSAPAVRCVHFATHSSPDCLALAVSPAEKEAKKRALLATRDASLERAKGGADDDAIVDVTEGEVAKAASPAAIDVSDDAPPTAVVPASSPPEPDEATIAAAEAEAEAEVDHGSLLTLGALAELQLASCPTVVLAGSHGGAGQLSQDGVLGLRRTFLAAGARSVLAASWDVADEPTQLLMSAFYAALSKDATLSQAAALRTAVAAVRAADGGKWDHPAHWASFSITGAAHGI